MPPVDQLARPGGTATFTVVAADTQSFQWYKDEVALSDGVRFTGSTTRTLTITEVTLEDVANYRVELRGNGILRSPLAALQLDPAVPDGPALPVAGTRDKFSDLLDERNAAFLPQDDRGAQPAGQTRPRPAGLARGTSGSLIFSTLGGSTESGEPVPCGVLAAARNGSATLLNSTASSPWIPVRAASTPSWRPITMTVPPVPLKKPSPP